MNTITLNSPTGRSTFHATLDKEMQRIVITNRSKREHYYHLDAINDLYLWLKNTMNRGRRRKRKKSYAKDFQWQESIGRV